MSIRSRDLASRANTNANQTLCACIIAFNVQGSQLVCKSSPDYAKDVDATHHAFKLVFEDGGKRGMAALLVLLGLNALSKEPMYETVKKHFKSFTSKETFSGYQTNRCKKIQKLT